MTQAQLLDLLVARLIRNHGGAKARWRKLAGPVTLYSLKTHPHCNWALNPTGTGAEIAQIENLLDELRQSHPVLEADR